MDSQVIGDVDFSGMTVLVAGLGISGASVASILRSHGVRVITVDEKKLEADSHSFDDVDWKGIGLVVTSPVFTPRTPFILRAQELGIPVWSEVEFAWKTRCIRTESEKLAAAGLTNAALTDSDRAPWIGITGTNGKTTTTEMIAAMCVAAGLTAPAAGNIGAPVSAASQDPANDLLCVELSSFALHFTDDIALDVAVWTNVDQDHLDWHGGFENYRNDKAKALRHARRAVVYNADDEQVSAAAKAAEVQDGCELVGFTLKVPTDRQVGVVDGWIVDRSEKIMRVDDLNSPLHTPHGDVYPHLLADALAAVAACRAMGIPGKAIASALKSFAPDRHRIELVGQYVPGKRTPTNVTGAAASDPAAAIRFVDDSKATNVHAAAASLAGFPDGSVVWIAGGLAKGSSIDGLISAYKSKFRAAIVIGVDREPFVEALVNQAPDVPRIEISGRDGASVIAAAVDAAMKFAQPGDTVLLAPAAASMDQFDNMADRGDKFAQAAHAWVGQHA